VLSLKYLRAFLLKHFYIATFVERSLFRIPIVQKLLDNLSRGQEAQHVYGGELLEALIGKGGDPTWDLMFEKTGALLKEFHEEARRSKIPFLLVVIPTIYQVKDDIRAEMVASHGTDLESLTKAQRELRVLGEREGFPVLDLLPVFREEYRQDRPVYWRFNPHFNPHGTRVTAEAILKHLTAAGYLEPE
jgi:hypothetical protein